MLALFAAAAVVMAPPPAERLALAQTFADASVFRTGRAGPIAAQAFHMGRLCKGAGRLQTSFAEPALLFREQDRDAARLRKLIELPPAEACLVDHPATRSATR